MDAPVIIPPNSLMTLLHELDGGVMNHVAWLKDLHRCMICDYQPNADDLQHDAHCRCKFGLWYYGKHYPSLTDNPRFVDIGDTHKMMHDQARELLTLHTQGNRIQPDRYNVFMDLAIDFRLAISKLQSEIIQHVCSVDHLTGVLNRHAMLHCLQEEHERMARKQGSSCICMMDLDYFKNVNDTYGHQTGDRVLQEAVRYVVNALRKYDTVFRYGGEEFMICLPDIGLTEAVQTIDRVREGLSQLAISIKDHGDIYITASFGVTNMDPDDSLENMIQKADHALLCAKLKGRNLVCEWRFQAD